MITRYPFALNCGKEVILSREDGAQCQYFAAKFCLVISNCYICSNKFILVMKIRLVFALCAALMLSATTADAQILQGIKKKVKEKMESLGIPVIVERSGYESDPLGRMEWIKFCAALVDKEEMAEKYFDNLIDSIQDVRKMAPTDKSVAIFYITSNGAVSVRKSGDYITKALKIAGGNPILFDAEEENAFSTMNIQMEVFYREAHDADILIYNSTIVKEIETIGASV